MTLSPPMPSGLRTILIALVLASVSGGAPFARAQTQAPTQAVMITLEGVIGPVSSDFVVRSIEQAEDSNAQFVVLRLNTPGGLDTAMREIIRKILASTVPVVSYVAPSGSRAASAGTYIVYASHIASMAPATNLGSATPVGMVPGGFADERPAATGQPEAPSSDKQLDDPAQEPSRATQPVAPTTAMERKVVNDAVAYIKGLARLRGRNEQWAEQAVRAAVSLTAEDALAQNVIDLVATDMTDLLRQLDGRQVPIQNRQVVLSTAEIEIVTIEPDWRTRFLGVITNPNVAYILVFLGMYGLFFELSNPGAILPGVLGAICLFTALYAFQVLPVNYAGLALLIVGATFVIAEVFVPSFGVLGLGGTIALVIGSIILMDTEIEAYRISLPLILATTLITVGFIFTLITLALRQRHRPIVSGREQLIGATGEVVDPIQDTDGLVRVHGELWSARSPSHLHEHQRVRIRNVDGLVLNVEPIEEPS